MNIVGVVDCVVKVELSVREEFGCVEGVLVSEEAASANKSVCCEYVDGFGEGVGGRGVMGINVGGEGWQDRQKMDSLRAAYQRAICVPMSALNGLWKEYEGWGPDVAALIKCMPEKPNKWSIHVVHPPLDSFVKGRVALIGDAVRPNLDLIVPDSTDRRIY